MAVSLIEAVMTARSPTFGGVVPIRRQNDRVRRLGQTNDPQATQTINKFFVSRPNQTAIGQGVDTCTFVKMPFAMQQCNRNHGIIDAPLLLATLQMVLIVIAVRPLQLP
jgi:hypothetical protein